MATFKLRVGFGAKPYVLKAATGKYNYYGAPTVHGTPSGGGQQGVGNGSSVTVTPLGGAPSGLAAAPYPRVAYYAIGGSQSQLASGNTAAGISFAASAAYYNLVVASPYLSAEPFSGGATYASMEATWKANAVANGITQNVIHYVMSQEQSGVGLGGNASTFAWWSAACQASQFWLYNTYPPGSPVFTSDNGGNTTYQLQLSINQANTCAATVNSFASPLSGSSYWKTFFQYYYDVHFGGQAVSKYHESHGLAANPNLNGFFYDNWNDQPPVAGAWAQNTTSYGTSNTTAAAWVQQGYANYAAASRAINPNFLVVANSPYFENYGSVTLDPSQQGLLDATICEGFWGTSYGPEARLGAVSAMQNLFAAVSQVNATGALLVNSYGLSNNGGTFPSAQSGWTTGDYQDIRAQFACSMMLNAYYDPNVITTNPSGMVVLAEMKQGGVCGWLGQPAATAQGAVQTAAWSQGVWRRDFQYGTVLWNPRGGSTATFTVGSSAGEIPSTLSYIANTGGFGDASVNTGSPVSGTVVLTGGNGLFLINTSGGRTAFTAFATKSGQVPTQVDFGQDGPGVLNDGYANYGPTGFTGVNAPYNITNRSAPFTGSGGSTMKGPHQYCNTFIAGCAAWNYSQGAQSNTGFQTWISNNHIPDNFTFPYYQVRTYYYADDPYWWFVADATSVSGLTVSMVNGSNQFTVTGGSTAGITASGGATNFAVQFNSTGGGPYGTAQNQAWGIYTDGVVTSFAGNVITYSSNFTGPTDTYHGCYTNNGQADNNNKTYALDQGNHIYDGDGEVYSMYISFYGDNTVGSANYRGPHSNTDTNGKISYNASASSPAWMPGPPGTDFNGHGNIWATIPNHANPNGNYCNGQASGPWVQVQHVIVWSGTDSIGGFKWYENNELVMNYAGSTMWPTFAYSTTVCESIGGYQRNYGPLGTWPGAVSASPAGNGATTQWKYWAQMYLDRQQSGHGRFVMSNSASWTMGSGIWGEVQPYTAWSTSSVTLTLNKGNLNSGQAYIYYVDEANNVAPTIVAALSLS